MIWGNPWAWLGLVAIALPVLIHLLGRGHAKVRPFPSLRFLERSKLLPTRRTRIHDWPLLLVRACILAAAVAALAQPWFASDARSRAVGSALVRAIVLDTSASVRAAAGDSAASIARGLAGEARASLVVETNDPARDIRGAADWLAQQPGTRELVIVSDFQRGTLDSTDLAAIAPDVGMKLTRVAATANASPIRLASRASTATIALDGDRANVTWTHATAAGNDVELLTSDADRAGARAASVAAATLGARLPFDSAHRIAVVFPSFARRPAARIDAPWMTAIVARVRGDSLLASAAVRAAALADTTGHVVMRNAARRPVIVAAQSDARLVFFVAAEPGSVTSAALIAAIDRARSIAPPFAELDPVTLDDATLAAWQRAPSDDVRSTDRADSDGRWFWLVALALLGVETWMRRERKQAAAAAEVAHARAA